MPAPDQKWLGETVLWDWAFLTLAVAKKVGQFRAIPDSTLAALRGFALMPRYFFHLCDGDRLKTDLDGSELPDLEAALREALESARFLLSEKVLKGEIVNGQHFEISDHVGKVLATLALRTALRLH